MKNFQYFQSSTKQKIISLIMFQIKTTFININLKKLNLLFLNFLRFLKIAKTEKVLKLYYKFYKIIKTLTKIK